jgi:hypothetical protein
MVGALLLPCRVYFRFVIIIVVVLFTIQNWHMPHKYLWVDTGGFVLTRRNGDSLFEHGVIVGISVTTATCGCCRVAIIIIILGRNGCGRIDGEPPGARGAVKCIFIKISVSKGHMRSTLGACTQR